MKHVVTVLVALFLVACGPGPKGTQLVELERLLQDPDASKVKEAPGAARLYQESRQFRRLALESYEDGQKERSEEYALLGWLKYRTAAAIAEQHDAKQRLDAANAKVSEVNPELRALNDEQVKLTAEVASLEKRVSLAQSNSKSLRLSGDNTKVDKDLLSRFNAKLIATERAKTEAEAVDANKHASGTFARANNQLKSVRAEFDSSNKQVRDGMLQDLDQAIILFNKSKSESSAEFANEKAKSDPAQRRKDLAAAASKSVGAGNVSNESNSVRITFKGSFSSGSSSVSSSLSSNVASLATIAQTFDEFSIRVEGFTDRGDATENLGLSQIRAKAVADILAAKGVKSNRVEHKGKGQDQRRFNGAENDRVELVLY